MFMFFTSTWQLITRVFALEFKAANFPCSSLNENCPQLNLKFKFFEKSIVITADQFKHFKSLVNGIMWNKATYLAVFLLLTVWWCSG